MKYRLLLMATLVLTAACATETTGPTLDMDAGFEPLSLVGASSLSPGALVIDDFSAGGGSWSACGHATFNLAQDASIIGGQRETVVRDAWSCIFGGRAFITIDNGNGTAEWHSNGIRTASHQIFNYGLTIGTYDVGTRRDGRGGPWGPNLGAGTELNLNLTLDDEIAIDMAQVYDPDPNDPYLPSVAVLLLDGQGGLHEVWTQVTVGVNLLPLSSFPNLTAAGAADIDGITVQGGVSSPPGSGFIFNGFGIEPAINDPQSKDECKKGGWEDFGFRNQGQCVRFVETGKDSR